MGNELVKNHTTLSSLRASRTSYCRHCPRIEKLQYAISNNYWFEFFMDDLPIYSFIGRSQTLGRSPSSPTGSWSAMATGSFTFTLT